MVKIKLQNYVSLEECITKIIIQFFALLIFYNQTVLLLFPDFVNFVYFSGDTEICKHRDMDTWRHGHTEKQINEIDGIDRLDGIDGHMDTRTHGHTDTWTHRHTDTQTQRHIFWWIDGF